MKLTVIILAILSSCRTTSSYEREYVSFYRDAFQRGCFVESESVYFARLEPSIAGYCVYGFGILLNEDNWNSYGPYQRLELMYHELGHCALNLDHSEPGLMSPSIHREYEVRENWTEWKEDLFKKCPVGQLPKMPK